MRKNESCKILPSGIKLFVNTVPDAKKIYSSVIFKCGSVYETPEKSGLSHFLEHMFFELDPSISAEEINKKVCELIAYKNAYTSDLDIKFVNVARKYKFKELFALFGHFVEHLSFIENKKNLESLEKQRKIITEEKRLEETSWSNALFLKKRKTIFAKTPFEKNIVGEYETINNIKLKDLKEHYEKFFIPENMNIIITGNITLKEAEKLVKQCFDGRFLQRSNKETLQRFNSAVSSIKKNFKIDRRAKVYFYKNENAKKDAVDIELISGGIDFFDEKFASLNVLKELLNRKLRKKIREKEKITYYVESYRKKILENDFFVIKSTIKEENIEKFLNCVADVFAKILQKGISEKKFKLFLETIKEDYKCISDSRNVCAKHDDFIYRIQKTDYKGILKNDYLRSRYEGLKPQDLVESLKEILKTEPMLTIFGKKYTKKIDEQKLKQMFSIESLMQRDYKAEKIDSIYVNNQAIEKDNYFSSSQMQTPKSSSLLQSKLNATYSEQEETSKSKEVSKPKEISNVIKNILATRSNGNTNRACLTR